MTCNQCDSELICRMKDYGGNFAPTLQWQNYDGSAHYKTTDGKSFSCNIPEEEETEQTRIPTKAPKIPDSPTTNSNLPLAVLNEKIDEVNIRLQKMDEMIQAIFRYTVDEQLKKK